MLEIWDLVDKLHAWPPLQYGLVALIVVVSGVTYWHVMRKKWGEPRSPATPETDALLLFHGPFGTLSAKIDSVIANQGFNKTEMKQAVAEALQGTRHSINSNIGESQAEIKEEVERVGQTIRDDVSGMRRELREMRAVVDNMHSLAIRIEARRRTN